MTAAPVVVHQPFRTGGRRATAHCRGRDEMLGTACSDHDLVVVLQAAGVDDPEVVLDAPRWVWAERCGGHPHEGNAA
ncbi:hypothetical protein ACFYRD_39440 [Streptomyces hirsutus]|uniref:hypothetical protein n=1 Tax=Streptomyces hirsutus TaxID=35620 RepID=UPI0036CA4662